ncbi:MAG: lipopolysaccharide kinase InaA family protein [Planctomycetota bacterium]
MLSFIRLDRKPYRWFINQAHRRFLETTLIGREETVYQAASTSAFKDNNARTIFTMTLPGQPDLPGAQAEMNLIVKRYKIRNWIEMLKATFISKAHQEVMSAAHLIQQHVNTVYPLGVLEKRRFGLVREVFVFLKKIDNVIPLKEFLARPMSLEYKDTLLKALGEFIREVHQARFFHKDLHTGNILINPESLTEGAPELYLIDLHRSLVRPHFAQAYGMYNLAQMVYSLSTVLPLTDAYRFVRYYRELDFRKSVFRDFVRTVFDMADDLRHKHWQSRNKRCLKDSSAYSRMRIKDKTRWENMFIDRGFSRDEVFGLIAQHDKIANQEPGKLFKHTKNHSISFMRYGSSDVVIKEYRYSIWNRILSFLGIHPARKEWFSISGLLVRNVRTAQPIALVEKKDLFYTWVNKAYVVAKKIEAEPTNQFLMHKFGLRIRDKGTLANKIRFIKQFALAVKTIHQKGIFHRDLKANNVLIRDALISNLSSFLFYFIDLDRVTFNRETTSEERITNLAQLNAAVANVVTRADRLRFYRFYAYGEECLPHKEEKEIIKRIMQVTIKRRHFWPLQG